MLVIFLDGFLRGVGETKVLTFFLALSIFPPDSDSVADVDEVESAAPGPFWMSSSSLSSLDDHVLAGAVLFPLFFANNMSTKECFTACLMPSVCKIVEVNST